MQEIREEGYVESETSVLEKKDRKIIGEILKEHVFSAESLINELTDYVSTVRRSPLD